MSDVQLQWIVSRKRDQSGRLTSSTGLPPGVEVDSRGMRVISSPSVGGFKQMYHKVWAKRGLKPDQVKDNWQKWLDNNPSYSRKNKREDRATYE